jgi:hypothetical protein
MNLGFQATLIKSGAWVLTKFIKRQSHAGESGLGSILLLKAGKISTN